MGRNTSYLPIMGIAEAARSPDSLTRLLAKVPLLLVWMVCRASAVSTHPFHQAQLTADPVAQANLYIARAARIMEKQLNRRPRKFPLHICHSWLCLEKKLANSNNCNGPFSD